jgi:hypothetical protein
VLNQTAGIAELSAVSYQPSAFRIGVVKKLGLTTAFSEVRKSLPGGKGFSV